MRLTVCCCVLLLVVGIRGQDEFDLSEAFDVEELTTKPQPGRDVVTPGSAGGLPAKPTMKPQPGGGNVVPNKPTAKPQPGLGDDFDLEHAVGGDDPYKKPTMKPQPGGDGGQGGDFGDSDLGDGAFNPDHDGHHDNPGGHANNPSGRAMHPSSGGDGQGEGDNKSMLAGILSTVAVAAVGAVSSFVAYQKKKLCFKGAAEDPENVNMESHKGDQSEPQAQSTLLAK